MNPNTPSEPVPAPPQPESEGPNLEWPALSAVPDLEVTSAEQARQVSIGHPALRNRPHIAGQMPADIQRDHPRPATD